MRRQDATSRRKRPGLPAVLAISIFLWIGWGGADDGFRASLAAAFYCILLGVLGHDQPCPEAPRQNATACTLLLTIATASLLWMIGSAWFPGTRPLTPDLLGIELAKAAGVVACLVLGRHVAAARERRLAFERWLIRSALCFVIVMIVTSAIATDASAPTAIGHSSSRMSGTVENANVLACVCGVIMIAALGMILRDAAQASLADGARVADLAIAAVAALLALGLCARTQSRFTLLAALAIAGIVYAAPFRDAARRQRSLWILPAALIPLTLLTSQATIMRSGMLADDARLRIDQYVILLRQVGETPWFGTGPASFPELNARLQGAIGGRAWDWHAAHNALLQSALEYGLPHAVMISAMLAIVIGQIWRGARNWRTDPLARGIAGCLILIAACASIDIALNFPAVAMLTSLLLGYLWRRSEAVDLLAQTESTHHARRREHRLDASMMRRIEPRIP